MKTFLLFFLLPVILLESCSKGSSSSNNSKDVRSLLVHSWKLKSASETVTVNGQPPEPFSYSVTDKDSTIFSNNNLVYIYGFQGFYIGNLGYTITSKYTNPYSLINNDSEIVVSVFPDYDTLRIAYLSEDSLVLKWDPTLTGATQEAVYSFIR